MKEKIESKLVSPAIGPYSQAVKCGSLVFVSGQIPVDRKTGTMPETIEEQTRQSIINIKYILNELSLDLNSVIKTTVYLQHMSDFAAMNAVYASEFKETYPARVAVEVAALPKNALIEIEAIASLD